MKNKIKINFISAIGSLMLFCLWTVLIQRVDVMPVGVNGTDVGLAAFNTYFHSLTGVNMTLYTITDWLGLVPLLVCFAFGGAGFGQLIKRKSLLKVDFDIIILGIYYLIVIFFYLAFEMIPINYRPVLINGVAEVSYPSSTTLLVLSVMPTLAFQVRRRKSNDKIHKLITVSVVLFSAFMVLGRMVSGVHWVTDIVGSVLLSAGLYCTYKGVILWNSMKKYIS